MKPLRVLSLGWGVQSWTLAAMAAHGDIEKPDLAIHSDTGHEHQGTYEFAATWGPWLEYHGIPVVTVRAMHHVTNVVASGHAIMIPAYTISDEGKKGQLRRQCTDRWKIRPMRKQISQELLLRGLRKRPGAVEMLLGISWDESERMKASDVQYITNAFPLIDQRRTRTDCIYWLGDRGLPVPPKSSCTFCPYKSRKHWRDLAREDGPDWHAALQTDNLIRDRRPPFPLFVHPLRIPLAEATRTEGQQTEMDLTCDTGYCFV
jgi:3'-phosphoadenosine 5'-phosphosulfate sulfotransferase (PAPS reductase)/FAD synthetase